MLPKRGNITMSGNITMKGIINCKYTIVIYRKEIKI